MQMAKTSDEIQIQIFANWPMSHAKRVTRDNRKKSRISCCCRDKETADRQNHGQTTLKMSSISDLVFLCLECSAACITFAIGKQFFRSCYYFLFFLAVQERY